MTKTNRAFFNELNKQRLNAWCGKVVCARRKAMGLSNYALADRSGVDPSWLRRFEKGKTGISLHAFILLADGLCADPGELFSDIKKNWETAMSTEMPQYTFNFGDPEQKQRFRATQLKVYSITIGRLMVKRRLPKTTVCFGSGVYYSQLQKIENGKSGMTLDTFFCLAKGLGMTPHALLDEIMETMRQEGIIL